MKKYTLISVILFYAFIQMHAQDPTLTIEFTTKDMGGFSHERHVLAVWIETDAAVFVKTPLVYADVQKSALKTWNAAPANGNEVDAITGATQLLHTTYTIIWDCQNLAGDLIPNGNYVLHIEMNNNHSQGPLAEINFTVDGNSFTLNPADETYFKYISLVYDPDISANISVTGVNITPDSISLDINEDYQLSASVEPANATDQVVTWVSNNPAVATVSTSGLVNALTDGSATITVSTNDGDYSSTSEITVIESDEPVDPDEPDEPVDPDEPITAINISSESIPKENFLIYPNPASDNITLRINSIEENLMINIININGAVVFAEELCQRKSLTINTSSLSKGIYYVTLISPDNVLQKQLLKIK